MNDIAQTPEPPYYAVIFTSVRTSGDHGYAATAQRMLTLAEQQPGFLGYEPARQESFGISVSYWSSLEAIKSWREHSEHRKIQSMADQWYSKSCIRICKVERSY